jgi:hypothetical protein
VNRVGSSVKYIMDYTNSNFVITICCPDSRQHLVCEQLHLSSTGLRRIFASHWYFVLWVQACKERQYKPALPDCDGLQKNNGILSLHHSSFSWQIDNTALNTIQGQFSQEGGPAMNIQRFLMLNT